MSDNTQQNDTQQTTQVQPGGPPADAAGFESDVARFFFGEETVSEQAVTQEGPGGTENQAIVEQPTQAPDVTPAKPEHQAHAQGDGDKPAAGTDALTMAQKRIETLEQMLVEARNPTRPEETKQGEQQRLADLDQLSQMIRRDPHRAAELLGYKSPIELYDDLSQHILDGKGQVRPTGFGELTDVRGEVSKTSEQIQALKQEMQQGLYEVRMAPIRQDWYQKLASDPRFDVIVDTGFQSSVYGVMENHAKQHGSWPSLEDAAQAVVNDIWKTYPRLKLRYSGKQPSQPSNQVIPTPRGVVPSANVPSARDVATTQQRPETALTPDEEMQLFTRDVASLFD